MSDNPLVKYYTDPKTYVKLPSGGNYYAQKPDLSVDGEVGVLAMTAVDEMMFQSPDNLLNGESLFKVIARCVPSIKDPKEIPNPDLDAILVAMRIATYGNDMETNAKCPSCGHENSYTVNLPTLLANVEMLEDETVVSLNDDIFVKIKPFTVASSIMLALYAVEVQQMQRQLQSSPNIDEVAAAEAIRSTLSKSSDRLVELIAASVLEVTLIGEPENTVVTDPKQIKEWIEVLTVSEYKAIRIKVEEISAIGVQKTMNAQCTECSHAWEVQIGVDPSSFFATR
jgi:hypothetical protein